jgi:SpoVK/Ycf46/Vps4 family AAA+-type ATPase
VRELLTWGISILGAALGELPTEAGVISFISKKTKNFTGAALKRVCQCAAYKSTMRESIKEEKKRIRPTTMDFNEPATVLEIRFLDHFEKAITAVSYMETMHKLLQ